MNYENRENEENLNTMGYNIPDMEKVINNTKQKCEDFLINGKWYEHYDDDCTFDNSGNTKLITMSKIDYITNIECEHDFYNVNYIYLGDWRASYISGSGKNHQNLSDKIFDDFYHELHEAFMDANIPNDLIDNLYNEYLHSINVFEFTGEIEEYYTKEKILQILNKN